LLFRHIGGRMLLFVRVNAGLLYHRQVTIFDIYPRTLHTRDAITQALEMMRTGMFGTEIRTYGDVGYDTFALAVLTLFGLLIMRESRKYVVAE
jgi:hypothetical protein